MTEATTQRRSGVKHRWWGGGGERHCLILFSVSSYQQMGRTSGAVDWPPNGSIMGRGAANPVVRTAIPIKPLMGGKRPGQGRPEWVGWGWLEKEGNVMLKGERKRRKSCKEGVQVEERAVQGPAKDSKGEQKRWKGKGTEENFLGSALPWMFAWGKY